MTACLIFAKVNIQRLANTFPGTTYLSSTHLLYGSRSRHPAFESLRESVTPEPLTLGAVVERHSIDQGAMSFTSIPVLDLALAQNPKTKPQFLEDLRDALIEVGFLYLKNVGISEELYERVITEGRAFFDIPTEEK